MSRVAQGLIVARGLGYASRIAAARAVPVAPRPRTGAALAKPRDVQCDPAGTRLPAAVSVARHRWHRRSRAFRRGRSGLHLRIHHALGRQGEHLAQAVTVGLPLDPLGEWHSLCGVVISLAGSRSCDPNLFRRSTMTTSATHGCALRRRRPEPPSGTQAAPPKKGFKGLIDYSGPIA